MKKRENHITYGSARGCSLRRGARLVNRVTLRSQSAVLSAKLVKNATLKIYPGRRTESAPRLRLPRVNCSRRSTLEVGWLIGIGESGSAMPVWYSWR